jgi:hypothetical protein
MSRIGFLSAAALFLCVAATAQPAPPNTPSFAERYCSGILTRVAPPTGAWVISGEEARTKATFTEGDYVYINLGAKHGAMAGQRFLVVRPVADPDPVSWFRGQKGIVAGLGTDWADVGQVRIVVAQPEFSIAQVENSCTEVERGDHLVPFAARPDPALKSEDHFDRFAPSSGGPTGVLAAGKGFHAMAGAGDIVYVNLGARQGVKPGDYLRIFRYQDGSHALVYQTRGMAENVYGFGHSPVKYPAKQLPREILGEAVVLRVSPTSSTALITYSLREIMMGSYAELESGVSGPPASTSP